MVEGCALGVLIEALAGATPTDAVDGALKVAETGTTDIFQLLTRRQEGPLTTGHASKPHITVCVVRAAAAKLQTFALAFAFATNALSCVLARPSVL